MAINNKNPAGNGGRRPIARRRNFQGEKLKISLDGAKNDRTTKKEDKKSFASEHKQLAMTKGGDQIDFSTPPTSASPPPPTTAPISHAPSYHPLTQSAQGPRANNTMSPPPPYAPYLSAPMAYIPQAPAVPYPQLAFGHVSAIPPGHQARTPSLGSVNSAGLTTSSTASPYYMGPITPPSTSQQQFLFRDASTSEEFDQLLTSNHATTSPLFTDTSMAQQPVPSYPAFIQPTTTAPILQCSNNFTLAADTPDADDMNDTVNCAAFEAYIAFHLTSANATTAPPTSQREMDTTLAANNTPGTIDHVTWDTHLANQLLYPYPASFPPTTTTNNEITPATDALNSSIDSTLFGLDNTLNFPDLDDPA